jgi:hypothetical protein
MTLRFDRRRRALMCAVLLSAALPLLAEGAERGKDEGGGGPEAIHLPFRGYGLTLDRKVVKIFGDAQYYTVWPVTDVSNLAWGSDPNHSSIASHPWSPWFLFISLGDASQGTSLYRLDLQTLTTTLETYIPPPGINWTALQGLGARCKSSLPGDATFYSFRADPWTGTYSIREVSNTGVEVAAGAAVSYPLFPYADNSSEWFGGPHWFAGLRLGHPPLISLIHPTGIFVQIAGMSGVTPLRPTGLLAYGSGAYYLSANDNSMRLVTTAGTATVLQYIQWGFPALPAPPSMIDLTNPPNFCTKIET